MARHGAHRIASIAGRLGLGTLGFGCLTASLFMVPTYVSRRYRSAVDEMFSDSSAVHSAIIGERIAEARFSDSFREVVDIVAGLPEPPSWEALRRILEERGKTDLWYSLRLRLIRSTGDDVEITYVRRPYHNPAHYHEFLRIANTGRLESVSGWVEEPGDLRDLARRNQDPAPAFPLDPLSAPGRPSN
ncbi:hypothetical protein [Planctomyces sp. SH-PL62]|uniref:hypothetical protein n=1 Tax=Planctomyces sp. SH-PL62 TaxID=1636152 RepID=UPI00078C20B0|nr:hypothetical protein [Planctomyces sp. SH-PL62]AMV36409.1 hypothetical protein VT85_03185 [Planctomyces sp. SH-PL62]